MGNFLGGEKKSNFEAINLKENLEYFPKDQT